MTTEQKAKSYDEALKRAEAAIDIAADKDLVKGVATTIFPELRESEDERIRKELIAFLKENHETGRAEETWSLSGIERWIAWLEKQKEQKHYWKPTETDVALFNKAVTTNKALTPVERAQLDIIRYKFGYCRATNCSGIMQKEQKPEWSKEDEANLNEALSYIKDDALKEFIKSLCPQAKQEQKPKAKLTGWVARDGDERLWVYEICPKKYSKWQQWIGNEGSNMHLDQESFPDLKWEDEPVEVEITIRKK